MFSPDLINNLITLPGSNFLKRASGGQESDVRIGKLQRLASGPVAETDMRYFVSKECAPRWMRVKEPCDDVWTRTELASFRSCRVKPLNRNLLGLCNANMEDFRSIPFRILGFLFIIVMNSSDAEGQEQTFSQQPANTTVIQGQDATLQCQVQNLAGVMMWQKDNIILGTQRDLPGYPRYSMTGDASSTANLQITSVEIGDDASYQCLVITTTGGHPPLYSLPAFLSVQVPPAAPVIDGHENGALVSLKPPASVTLACRSNNGKPAASLTWLKNGQPLLHITPTVTIETAEDGSGKLQNTVSTIELLPEEEDNGIVFTCKLQHPAVTEPQNVSVTLNILFPPSTPLINGYTEGTIVRTNDELTLECSSRGGNPLAEIYWYKNGQRMDYSYTTDGDSARNVLPLTVGYGDNNAVFRCEVTSIVLDEPMTAQVTLTVLFAPAFVNITGHENMVHSGDSLTLTCVSGNSNPEASITWLTGGRVVRTHQDVVTEAPNGGFITTQKLNITMTAAVDKVDYICQATNRELLVTVDQSVTVSVMYPPNQPIITGYSEGAPEVRAGNLLRLQCYATGGNPLATLQWYKNGVALESETSTSTSMASAELTIVLEQTDNGALYQCNASNTATPVPLQANETLNVVFPPEYVTVTAEPAVASVGERVVIKCVTASSNPVSGISWWRDGILYGENPNPQKVRNGENGGKITSNKLVIESLEWKNNGGVYLCRATNGLSEESVNDGLTLDVRYKPIITTQTGVSNTTREVQGSIIFHCSAHGNPSQLTRTWKKNGSPVSYGQKYVVTPEGTISIVNPTKNDAGNYQCVVSNSVGEAEITASLTVEYAATITAPGSITITLGILQELVCTADANPRPDGFITWSRDGLDISMHTAIFRDGNGVLQIQNVTKSDAGMYTCHANNGIEPAAKKDINVIIQYKPEIDFSIPNKVAKTPGQTALLRCAAEGAPVVRFRWLRGRSEVNLTSHHYTLDNRQHARYTNHYESRLIVSQITISNYGPYICEAYNSLGTSTFIINIERTSSPEAPVDLRILRTTHHSVHLNWTAGFDGGLPQSFQVRFNTQDAKQYQYIDVDPPNLTNFVVENLNSETKYEFTVRGKNALGDGPYYLGVVIGITKAKPIVPTFRPQLIMVGNLPLYAVLLLAFVVILSCMFLNFLLCCCLVKRRFAKTSDKTDKEKKAEIEMTNPESETGRSSPGATESTGTRSRQGSDAYSYDDRQNDYQDYRSYDYRHDDRYDGYEDDDDMRPIADLEHRENLPSYYNSGYPRKSSYQPSWDSYYHGGPGSYVSDSQASEEQEEMDYADTLRRKQREDPYARSTGTPSPVPSNHGNFIPLKKGHPRTLSITGSQEGFLV